MPHSDYPISRLFHRIIQESGLRRSQFIRAIGFKNISKGLRRLDEWLTDGRGDKCCLQRVVDFCHPDSAELQSALQETEAIHQRAERGEITTDELIEIFRQRALKIQAEQRARKRSERV